MYAPDLQQLLNFFLKMFGLGRRFFWFLLLVPRALQGFKNGRRFGWRLIRYLFCEAISQKNKFAFVFEFEQRFIKFRKYLFESFASLFPFSSRRHEEDMCGRSRASLLGTC